MNLLKSFTKPLMLSMALLLVALAVGCKGGRDPILGGGGIAALPPTVTAVTPLDNATSVPLSNPSITATFSEPMAPITGGATFTVVSAGTGASPTGTVALDATNRIATFTITSGALTPLNPYIATVTGAKSSATGLALASPYVWRFTTGPIPDTTRPRVTITVPATTIPGPTAGVSINTAITAAFTKDMAPATITAAGTFTLTGPGTTSVSGAVTYASRTAVFTPAAVLIINTTYTATITTAATDLAGNALAGNQAPLPAASNYVWTFTTGSTPDATRPRVTSTVPATTIPGPTPNVPINTAISATFTKDMAPATIIAAGTFTVTGPGTTAVSGAVTYASRTAIFTPATLLTIDTTYTATITVAATDLAGNALAGNQPPPLPAASTYIWTFRTGLAPDTTRPRVILTVPATTIPGPTTGVPTNTAITALFSEDMAPATINAASFTVTRAGGIAVDGGVTYVSRTAIFTPNAVLAADTTYTATITKAATDLAGNQLAGNQPPPLPAASDYVWTFKTSAPVLAQNVSVLSTNPAAGAGAVCPSATINATFNVPSGLRMDPTTVNATTFTVTGPGPTFTPVNASSVLLDTATGRIATFTPSAPLTVGVTYTATIKSGATGVKDLAIPANTMVSDFTWNFTVGPEVCLTPTQLGSAGAFGIMATSAITNTGFSIINGDVSLDPGTSFTGYPPLVLNGTYHNNDTVSAKARLDLLAAYNYYKTLPPGITISGGADLGALYPLGIPPGTYTSGSTMLVSTPLVLDAGGNANAVWVFQIGSSLTTGANVSVANGAQAKNVFWVPTSDATIGVGTIFYGTLVTGRDATCKTGATINGRILAGAITAGTIALDTNTINVPAP